MKFCSRCEQWKHLEDFPRDRTRADRRWHTCKRCHNERRRLRRAEAREFRKQKLLLWGPPPPVQRSRLHILTKAYRRKTCGADHLPFSHLPPDEKFNARKLHQKSRAKRGRSLTQPKDALLGATAASNARRVKDKWWARSMRARKGWRTRLEREFGELLHQAQMRALSGWRHQADYETGVGWTRASRLWGI